MEMAKPADTRSRTVRSFNSHPGSLDGRAILITGGTGSFGQRFARHVLTQHKPARLVIFSRDEMKQYEAAQTMNERTFPAVRYFIGDVRDRERLEMAMRGIDTVIHAAALKHVPAAEYNPFECIHTNVMGSENVVRAALNAGVRAVLALSTDKAVSPANLYGASKLAAERIFVAANNVAGHGATRYAIVRYGNVVGSRGSVVPLFRRRLAEGATSLPITDPRMTRFWITLDQGVDFVVSALEMMQGGEIFVPKIPSMRVADLATAMAPEAKHDVVGIRPGEKLHEALITVDEARNTLEMDDRFIVQPSFTFWRRAAKAYSAATPVAEDFTYTSDNNGEWLDVPGMRDLLAGAGLA